jgi:hypothetical protein
VPDHSVSQSLLIDSIEGRVGEDRAVWVCRAFFSKFLELFFKWIKQHLRIKAFYGTSESAVKTQIWIAVSVNVLVAIVRKRLAIKSSLYSFLQILSLTLCEKMPLFRAFEDIESQDLATDNPK